MRRAALAILTSAFFSVAAAEETVVVTSARVPSLIGDEPIRIEAVPSEEIEENLTVQPGNISTLLNELPSARIQAAAPGLGGVGLQLRGMPTRHTLVLTDGLPLLGAESDDFGLLQTPPLDLERIELIKGAASALYGGSALGGVLNIVSKSPKAQSAILANATSRGGRDLEAFLTDDSLKEWSGTLTAGVHDQSREDVNHDGWADIPGFRRYSVRPRIWWDPGDDQSVFFTGGITEEHREGGTLLGQGLPTGDVAVQSGGLSAPGRPEAFRRKLRTRRVDGGMVGYWKLSDALTLNSRVSITSANLDRTFGEQRIPSTQTTIFSEQSFTGATAGHQWAAGVAFQHDALRVESVGGVGYTYNVPGVFVQDEFSPATWIKLAAAGRVDSNNQYGTYASPRLSALFRQPGSPWSLRASAGGGFAAPTPFVEEVESTSLGSARAAAGIACRTRLDRVTGWQMGAGCVGCECQCVQFGHSQSVGDAAGRGQRLELVNDTRAAQSARGRGPDPLRRGAPADDRLLELYQRDAKCVSRAASLRRARRHPGKRSSSGGSASKPITSACSGWKTIPIGRFPNPTLRSMRWRRFASKASRSSSMRSI